MQIINYWCFTLNRINWLDLPAEVPFHSFFYVGTEGPSFVWKSLGPSVQKEAQLCSKIQ